MVSTAILLGIPTETSEPEIPVPASWDNQVSEGQSLSEPEEAVLQALELMTHYTTQTVWIKSALLRDKVMSLMGSAADKTGDGQWIGHVLKLVSPINKIGHKCLNNVILCDFIYSNWSSQ
jgi:hypothetical protein